MEKKNDLPAFPFYFGDWRKAGEIRALDLDVRMIWFEMMGFMWESTERGYLTLNGKPVSNSVITKMIGIDITTFERALQQMEDFNVFSRRDDGAIYSRKMVRDEEIRQAKAKAGKAGMKKRYGKNDTIPVITDDITKHITNTENEIENTINNKKGDKSALVIFEAKELCDELFNSDQWITYILTSTVATSKKITKEQLKAFIISFIEEQRIGDTLNRSISEYKRHFFNWFKKQMINYTPPKVIKYVEG